MVVDDSSYSVIMYLLLFFAGDDDCFETLFRVVFTHFPLFYVKSQEVKPWFFPLTLIKRVG